MTTAEQSPREASAPVVGTSAPPSQSTPGAAAGRSGARRHRIPRGRRRSFIARAPLTRDTVCERAEVPAASPAGSLLREIWDRDAAEGRARARTLRAVAAVLAVPTSGRAGEGGETFDREEAEFVLAQALHSTIGHAGLVLEEALRATRVFSRTFALLEAGSLPQRWHRRLLRLSGDLGEDAARDLDEIVAGWDMSVGEESFRRRLALEIRRLRDQQDQETGPETPERSVHVGPGEQDDGTACLTVCGPAPEILALGHRLDAAARAVLREQRSALAAGDLTALPFDDGSVAATGVPMPLARLRYEILTRSVLETPGVEVPRERFRLVVTVPAMTLLGRAELPGTLEGTIPLPAVMARDLAGGEDAWFRVLTDPTDGTFLPLPARRYTPTPSMLEHLRLRNAVCAVPGCARGVRHGAEADHIEEFDPADPASGGRTEVENLHLLCRRHHQMKTARALDPRRMVPDDPRGSPRGTTSWSRGPDDPLPARIAADDGDLMTPQAVQTIQRAHARYTARISAPDEDDDTADPPDGPVAAGDPFDGPPPF